MIPTSLRRAWCRGREAAPEPAPAEPVLAATVPTPATWETDVLFVCLRCSGKQPGGLAEDGRTVFRQWVREKMTAEGRKKALRVVETSCLGLCPDGRVAVAIGRELAAGTPVIRSVATEADREAIYRLAIEPR